MTVFHSGNYQL